MRRTVAIAFLACTVGCVVGCGDQPKPPACTGVCVAPSWTRLDLVAGRPGGSGFVDGVGAAVHFSDPWTFTGDGAGKVWIADASMIRTIDEATMTVTTLAGAPGQIGTADGVGSAARFNQPGGITYANGKIYVCDTENHTVRTLDPASATVALYAGGVGMPGSSDGPVASALFREPEGLIYDGTGALYVGDVDNNTIRKIDLASAMVSTVAGQVNVAGNADGVGTAATFNKPKQLAFDSAGGRLLIVDSLNNSVRAMKASDGTVTTLATFTEPPEGLAAVGSDVWVSLVDNRVVRIDAAGTVSDVAGMTNATGFADGIGAAARFFRPAGLWVESGRVIVADNGNYAVRAIATADAHVTTILGAIAVGSSDGAAADARFFVPQGIAVAGDTAYVADTDNHTIRAVTISTGAVTTLAGTAGQATFADGTGADARFNTPIGVVLDDAGTTLYVADSGNRSLRAVDVTTGAVTTPPINGAPGSMFARFNTPAGLARDGTHLYVSDSSDHVIVAIDLATNLVTNVAGSPRVAGTSDGVGMMARFNAPSGLATDGHGTLYVADTLNQAIRKIALATGTVTTLAGAIGIPGSDDGSGAEAHFTQPGTLAIDGLGDLFVADVLDFDVRHIDLSNGAVTTVVGVAGDSGVTPGPLPAQLGQPTALALTSDARLLVASESSILIAH